MNDLITLSKMKAKLILLVIAALIMSACAKTSEDKVTEAFMEYVRTDFDNPNNFIEITKIEKPDTFDVKKAMSYSEAIDSVLWVFPKSIRKKYEYRKQQLIEESPCVIIHKLNVRVKFGKGKVVNKYWVVEQDGEMKVQSREPKLEEMPHSFSEYSKIVAEMYTVFLKAVGGME